MAQAGASGNPYYWERSLPEVSSIGMIAAGAAGQLGGRAIHRAAVKQQDVNAPGPPTLKERKMRPDVLVFCTRADHVCVH